MLPDYWFTDQLLNLPINTINTINCPPISLCASSLAKCQLVPQHCLMIRGERSSEQFVKHRVAVRGEVSKEGPVGHVVPVSWLF